MKIKLIKYFCIIVGIVIVFDIFKYNQFKNSPQMVLYHASWSYNYHSIKELYQNSDLIAIVKISNDGICKEDTSTNLCETVYSAQVIRHLKGVDNEKIKIYMTGGIKNNIIYQLPDDPLMTKGESYLIFAKKNNDGTYTTLSGQQGRMYYDNKQKTCTSLNEVTELKKSVENGSSIHVQNLKLTDLIQEFK